MANQQHAETSWSLPKSLQVMERNRGDRIYTDFFNLNSSPFSITPDPEFLFLSETHRSVLEKIQYGIQNRMGFMLLTGEVGTGKTTLCRTLLDDLQNRTRTVYVINPALNGLELLAGILDDLDVAYPQRASKKELIDRLNNFLLENEDRTPVVIIVDDAQTMPPETLEDLRLLSNLETDKTKLLQMLLVGQPELLIHLEQPRMRQLRQRVAVNCQLDYLSLDEVGGYIERRLFIAGNQGQIRFASKVIRKVHQKSGGVPRMINKICDMALIAAFTDNSYVVQPHHLKAAASELIELQGTKMLAGLRHRPHVQWLWKRFGTAVALLCAMMLGFMANRYMGHTSGHDAEDMLSVTAIAKPLGAGALPMEGHVPAPAEKPSHLLSLASRAYILQLGSFNTLATTLRAVDIYTRRGIPAHWNELHMGEKGLWYRVFTGRFESMDAARHYQNTHALKEAQILFAPWTVLIDRAGSVDRIAGIQKHVQSRGVDVYSEIGGGNRLHLCAGAFVTPSRALVLAQKIHRQTGVAVRVANLHSALISENPTTVSDAGGDPS